MRWCSAAASARSCLRRSPGRSDTRSIALRRPAPFATARADRRSCALHDGPRRPSCRQGRGAASGRRCRPVPRPDTANAPTGVFSSWLMLATKSVRTASSRARSLTSSMVASAPPSSSGMAWISQHRRGGPMNSTVWPLAWPRTARRDVAFDRLFDQHCGMTVVARAAMFSTRVVPVGSASTTPMGRASSARAKLRDLGLELSEQHVLIAVGLRLDCTGGRRRAKCHHGVGSPSGSARDLGISPVSSVRRRKR